MISGNGYNIMNADDERPNCQRCDNQDRCETKLSGQCGPEKGWRHYKRYVGVLTLQTADGIKFFCLPDGAKCMVTGDNPENMDRCPMRNFDNHGCICVPESCDKYTEE